MSSRLQQRSDRDYYAGNVEVTHATMDTIVSLPGNIDLLQIQVDTTQSESVATSLLVQIDGNDVKRRGFSAPGTAEITFMGHRKLVSDAVVLSRPGDDSHEIFWTMIYVPRP